ncbi:pentapeptide repeat-containing protein [Agrobacterium vitis]|uniref:pentapeptide repeat-containing protein n=1 Tax=Rhizobium/Agrobacterium group TaxID=227290 RepID=UPI0008DC2033|nr:MULTISPECIES: pentapeptide repeat-containing protein [Rhizobium/Agrobacterium group]MCF1435264.1 pentapeptide repeat-containing protein [Allorhizobium ampelinum]MUO89896.1 pentapeptide repeat-containing protein [Agrobacterium vitis]MUZ53167.1 pentapeptide repeat-containing protein [Agrobacterium vitis]MUZ91386.1 pentapeptide repeat-containing protein [Agrobacterium vitis]MVA40170.1 pentapeptide repeat-containing protein [Agrobacterium vitis]
MQLHGVTDRLDVKDCDLSGSEFLDANLSGLRVNDVNLSGAEIHDANLSGLQIVGCRMTGATIDGISVEELLAAYRSVHSSARSEDG